MVIWRVKLNWKAAASSGSVFKPVLQHTWLGAGGNLGCSMKKVNFKSFPKASLLYFFSNKPYRRIPGSKVPAVHGIDITVSPIPALGKETQRTLVYLVQRNLKLDETEHVF